MIAEVTPLIKLPRKTKAFDYTVSEEMEKTLCVGQGVKIPFRNKRSVKGIVITLKEQAFKKGVPLKQIKTMIPDLVMEPWQMQLAHWISAYYHCSLANALKLVQR